MEDEAVVNFPDDFLGRNLPIASITLRCVALVRKHLLGWSFPAQHLLDQRGGGIEPLGDQNKMEGQDVLKGLMEHLVGHWHSLILVICPVEVTLVVGLVVGKSDEGGHVVVQTLTK